MYGDDFNDEVYGFSRLACNWNSRGISRNEVCSKSILPTVPLLFSSSSKEIFSVV